MEIGWLPNSGNVSKFTSNDTSLKGMLFQRESLQELILHFDVKPRELVLRLENRFFPSVLNDFNILLIGLQ